MSAGLIAALQNDPPPYAGAVIATSPVSYWRLGESSGTNAVDVMGANPGTYVGSPTLGVAGALSGDTDTAVTFTRTAGIYVDISTATFPLGATARTLACWVKTTLDARQGFFGYGAAGANGTFNLEYANGGPGLSLIGYGAGDLSANNGTTLVDGAWHFIAATYNGTTIRLYQDGTEVANGARSLNTASAGAASIGRQSYPDATYWEANATIDEPAYWSRALTATEVATLYAAGKAARMPYSLLVDGVDVIKEPATPSRYGVDLTSIRVTQAGPGAVSSMSFDVWDASKVLTFDRRHWVTMWDLVNDVPVFAGWVDHFSNRPAFGTGRIWHLECIGIEAILDQVIVPSLAIPAGGYRYSAMQSLAAFAPLRAFSDGSTVNGNQANPVGSMYGQRMNNALSVAGVTLRDGIQQTIDQSMDPNDVAGVPIPASFSVDYWGGLRAWPMVNLSLRATGNPIGPNDYDQPHFTETTTGGVNYNFTSLSFDVDFTQVVTAVYVNGTGIGGWVVGDQTYGRIEAYLSDSTVTTTSQLNSLGSSYLAAHAVGTIRGTLTVENATLSGTPRLFPASLMVLTVPEISTSSTYAVTEVQRTFLGTGKQNLTIAFGGAIRPSLARALRGRTTGRVRVGV